MGFAYKGTEEYLYAAYCFRKAMTESLSEQQSFPRNRGDQRICVEAYYEGANALTAIGQYKDAIESYNDALMYAKECAFPQQWFRKSLGDAIRKRGNSGQSSTDYADSRDKYQQEAEYNKQALGSPAFGIGQTYLGEALLGSEREPTAGNDTLFRKAVNWFESARSEGCTNPLLFAYWGYALKMITRSDNPEFKDHLSRAIEAQHKNEKDNPGNAQVNYDLAVCYAMNEDVTEALEYLNKAFAKSDAAYCWALQMDSADFAGIRKSPRWKVEEERIKVRVERIKKEWEELKTSDSCCDFA